MIGTSSYSNLATGATNNTAVGVDALPAISTGDKNVAIGNDALLVAAAGLNNVAVGFNAAKKITSGSFNIGPHGKETLLQRFNLDSYLPILRQLSTWIEFTG